MLPMVGNSTSPLPCKIPFVIYITQKIRKNQAKVWRYSTPICRRRFHSCGEKTDGVRSCKNQKKDDDSARYHSHDDGLVISSFNAAELSSAHILTCKIGKPHVKHHNGHHSEAFQLHSGCDGSCRVYTKGIDEPSAIRTIPPRPTKHC